MLQWLKHIVGAPAEDRFAQQIIDGLRRAGDQRRIEYEKNEFRLQFYEDGEAVGTVNLRNLFLEYQRAARIERTGILQRTVRAVLSYKKEIPDEFEDARPDIRPAVRARSFFEGLRDQSGTEEAFAPYIEVSEHLGACLVYDMPEGMQFITQRQLDDWSVTLYEAMEAAKQNLAEAEATFAVIDEGTHVSGTGDCYDASRLLLLDMIRSMKVRGDTIAMVPNRDWLVVTGSEDDIGLQLMAKIASDKLAEARPLSGIALKLQGDEWIEWHPPTDHSSYGEFKELQLQTLAIDYADQKTALDELAEKEGADHFVATFTVAKKDNEVLSYCVRSKGIVSLLPKTDRVMFFCPEEKIVAGGSWEHVQSVVGELMEQLDMYPPRYRVDQFPSDEQLGQIGTLDNDNG